MVVQRKNKSHMRKKVSKSFSKSRSKRQHQGGGSPASDLVNMAANSSPVKEDYVTSPRIRDGTMAESYGGQCGGSDASTMVMNQLANNSTTNTFPEGLNVKGNMDSLNLYQPSGGSRKSRKHTKGRKSHKKAKGRKSKKSRKSNKSHKSRKSLKSSKSHKRSMMKGGASDWMSSQYSLGSYNASEAGVGQFSQSAAASRADYMNPPNLGLAGSGAPMGALEGAGVRSIGSPLV